MTKIFMEKKCMTAETSTFREVIDPSTGKNKYILTTKIVPFGKISRNGVMYNKESILKTRHMIKQIPVMFNHVLEGANTMSRGEWEETWVEADGLHGRARIYDTQYNIDLIEYLQSATSPKVSLQIQGNAEQQKDPNGNYYKEAEVTDWLEISIVNCPGFMEAAGTIESFMCEAFDNNKNTKELGKFFESINTVREKLLNENDDMIDSKSTTETVDTK